MQNDNITAEELEDYRTNSWVIFDTRRPDEYKEGHINADLNLDYYSGDFAEQLNGLDKEDKYIVYCKSGGRSSRAMSLMKELGFKNVKNLEGGITGWIKKGLSIVRV